MRRLSCIKTLPMLASLLLTGLASHAQRVQPLGQSAEAHATFQYLSEKVMPSLQKQRQKLELHISAADKTTLAAYHAALQRQAASFQSVSPVAKETARRQLLHDGMREAEQLAPLVSKYAADSQKLLSELEPQRRQWVAGFRAIHREHSPGHTCTASERLPSLTLLEQLLTPRGFTLLSAEKGATQ